MLGLSLQPVPRAWSRSRGRLFHHALAASYIHSAPRTPGHAAGVRNADKR
jgi:hypothetical protein